MAVGRGQPEPRAQDVERDAVRIRRGEDAIAGIGRIRAPTAGRERGGTRRGARCGVDQGGGRREGWSASLSRLTVPPFGTGLTLAVSVTGWPIHTTGIAPEGVPVLADRDRVLVVLVEAKDKLHVLDGVGGDPVCRRDRHRVGAYGARRRCPVDRSDPEGHVRRKGKPRWQGARCHGQGRRGRPELEDLDGPAVVVRVREPALDQFHGGGAPPLMVGAVGDAADAGEAPTAKAPPTMATSTKQAFATARRHSHNFD